MNKQEAEQLAKHIRVEAPKMIAVLGIDHLGPSNPSYATEFGVKCACKITSFQFIVQSLEHWEDLKEHVIIRLCKMMLNRLISKKHSLNPWADEERILTPEKIDTYEQP